MYSDRKLINDGLKVLRRSTGRKVAKGHKRLDHVVPPDNEVGMCTQRSTFAPLSL